MQIGEGWHESYRIVVKISEPSASTENTCARSAQRTDALPRLYSLQACGAVALHSASAAAYHELGSPSFLIGPEAPAEAATVNGLMDEKDGRVDA